jgi:hypothetical protein
MSLSAVPSMHKQVHQRTRQQQQIRKPPQHVSPVFGEHEEANDGQEEQEYDASS